MTIQEIERSGESLDVVEGGWSTLDGFELHPDGIGGIDIFAPGEHAPVWFAYRCNFAEALEQVDRERRERVFSAPIH